MAWTEVVLSVTLTIVAPLLWAVAAGYDALKQGDREQRINALRTVAACLAAGLIAGLLICWAGDKSARRTIEPHSVQGIDPDVVSATTDTTSGNKSAQSLRCMKHGPAETPLSIR